MSLENNQLFNFLKNIPDATNEEVFQTLLKNDKIKIERIVSKGQTTPKNQWYDQEEDEFVIVLEGNAIIVYDDGKKFKLSKGDSLYIKAHQKHRVSYTSDGVVWLAVFV